MPTRREQLHAYRFVSRRIVSAMLSGEPESSMLPMRRLGLAAFASAMVGVIVFAGVGVYGLLRPGGNDSWKKDGTFIIERESGARFVYQGGKLRPIVNYASARLIVGTAEPQEVSASSLRGVPRGAATGITGAPDTVPASDALVGLPWIVCSSPRYRTTTTTLATELMVGRALPGGSDPGSRGLLVHQDDKNGTMYLLWHDHRYEVPDETAAAALGLPVTTPAVVGSAMLNAVPEGPRLAAPTITGAGGPGLAVDGSARTVGDVFRVGARYFVLLGSGLVPVGEATAKLVLGGEPATSLPATAVRDKLSDDTQFEPDGMPATVPELTSLSGEQPAVCASFRGDGSGHGSGHTSGPVRLRLYRSTPAQLRPDADGPQSTSGPRDAGPVADRIVVPGGHGALVREEPAPGTTAGTTVYLVTDQGRKYALMRSGKSDARTLLGYDDATPVPVPSELLDLVPTGPPLDPAAALLSNTVVAPSPTVTPHKQGG
ncbi:MAG: type VII secretion protein EccB [Actinocatenispora sp.]